MSGQWWNDDEVEGEPTPQPPAPDASGSPAPVPPPTSTTNVDRPTYDVGQVPPVAHEAPAKEPARGIPVAVAIAAVLALIGGLLVYTSLSGGDDDVVAQGEIFLERADEAGTDPFFDEYATLVSFDPSDVEPPQAASNDAAAPEESAAPAPLSNAEILALSFKGNEPGLYGGTGNNATCNKAALIAFLETTPDMAAAWSGAQGIQVAQIRPFVESLTTVVLLADTRVTNHGFRNGVANPIQSVLQAGMAVMIDEIGIPRVKCGCGNPLNKPIPQSRTVVLKGDPWRDFDQTKIATVEPAPEAVGTFVLRSTDTGLGVERPAGTDGEADRVTSDPAPRPTDDLITVGAAGAVASDLTSDPAPTSTTTPTTTTREQTAETTEPSVESTDPPIVLDGDTYCEKYSNYVAQSIELFDDLSESEGEVYLQFLKGAIRDLAANSPPQLEADWRLLDDIYDSISAEEIDLLDTSATEQAASDAVIAHAETVCGIDFG